MAVLKARALELRRNLRDMQVLVRRGLLPTDCLNRLEDNNDPKELAFDLLTMVVVVCEHWNAGTGKSALQESELDTIQQVAGAIVQAMGEKLQNRERSSSAKLMRHKAFAAARRVRTGAERIEVLASRAWRRIASERSGEKRSGSKRSRSRGAWGMSKPWAMGKRARLLGRRTCVSPANTEATAR
jgi:hypothetical protein